MDSQTSADVQDVSKFGLPDADGAGGACTNAMLLTLVSHKSYADAYWLVDVWHAAHRRTCAGSCCLVDNNVVCHATCPDEPHDDLC